MKYVAASEFQRNCYRLMAEVARTGEPITVTKRGRPLVQIVTAEVGPDPLFGRLRGDALYEGDVVNPTGEVWDGETK